MDATSCAKKTANESSAWGMLRFLRRPILIFWAALIVRLVYIAFLPEGYYFSDFRNYEQAAVSLLSGDGFGAEYQRPPLYPLFIAAHYLLFGPHFFPMRLMQGVLGALGSLLIYWIARRLLGERAGKIAGWISVFYPYYIFIAGLLYPTLLSATLHLLALAALLKAQQGRFAVWTAASAACLAFAALATPVSLAFLPFMLWWILAFGGFLLKQRLISAGIALFIVFLGLLPWTYYNYQRTGRITLVDARAREHMPYFVDGDTTRAGQKNAWQDRIPNLVSNMDKFALRTAKEFIHFWTFVPDRTVTKDPEYREKAHQADQRIVIQHSFTSRWLDYVSILTYGPVLVLALAGLILNWAHRRKLSLIIFLLISQAIGYSFFFTQVRYRLPVEFCLMILAAGALNYLWLRMRKEEQTA